jgi:hypothetical protein
MNVELDLPETKVIKTKKDKFRDILITVETTEDHAICRICKKSFISAIVLIERDD